MNPTNVQAMASTPQSIPPLFPTSLHTGPPFPANARASLYPHTTMNKRRHIRRIQKWITKKLRDFQLTQARKKLTVLTNRQNLLHLVRFGVITRVK